MKWIAFAAALTLSASAIVSSPTLARAESCTNDIDCTSNGTACGTDVCSWNVNPHECVAASTGNPGWCTKDTDCKCAGEGATCAANYYCTFTTPKDAGTTASSGSSSSQSNAASGGGGGGSSGGCTVGFGSAGGGASFAAFGIACACLVGGARRRRRG